MKMLCHIFQNKTDVISLAGGRNNKLFLGKDVIKQNPLVIKAFPLTHCERFKREVLFLEQCRLLNISQVPIIVDKCEKHLCVSMTKVPGASILSFSKKEENDIFDFITTIQKITFLKKQLPSLVAIEAVTRIEDFDASIISRINYLENNLSNLLKESRLKNIISKIQKYLNSSKYQYDSDQLVNLIQNTITVLDTNSNFISTSDFGVHNCKRDANKLFFIDFEYSGLDSGINFIGDLMMQPDTKWESGDQFSLGLRLLDELFGVQSISKGSIERLFGIRWALIIINRLNNSISEEDKDQYAGKIISYFNELPI
jgi:hypothetical protein